MNSDTMKETCDLHTHSIYSDGSFTPAELILAAKEANLSALALTDHNTVDGLPDFLAAAKGSGIEAITGAEFSVELDGTELHLLGLFIKEEYFTQVNDLMTEVQRRKEESNRDLIDALKKNGFPLDYDELSRKTPRGKFNRAHIGQRLTELGYTASVQHALDTLLSPKTGYYHEPKRITVWEMLDFLGDIHAVPVLAHPFLNLQAEELAAFLPKARERGLIGMECRYTTYDKKKTALAEEMAETFGLKPSGGSDFHGEIKPDIHLGAGRGNLKIPYEWARNLRAE